jgi:hypothetical protein
MISENKNFKLEVVQDENPESPRDWDNLGKMICFHKRYNLGDKHDFNIKSFNQFIKENKCFVMPILMYEHSGISLSLSHEYPFNDRWDAGQLGFIYVTYEDIKKEYKIKSISKKTLEKVKDMFKNEIEVYNKYLNGEVYMFNLSKKIKCKCCQNVEYKLIDGCCGFYDIDDIKCQLDKKYIKLFEGLK